MAVAWAKHGSSKDADIYIAEVTKLEDGDVYVEMKCKIYMDDGRVISKQTMESWPSGLTWYSCATGKLVGTDKLRTL